MAKKKGKSAHDDSHEPLDDARAQLADLTASVFCATRATASASDIQRFIKAREALLMAVKKLL